MKRSLRIGFVVSLLILSLGILSSSVARSQTAAPTQVIAGEAPTQAAPAQVSTSPKASEEKKAPEPENEEDAFRHSPAVQKFASILHLPVETAARLFEFLNFGVLAFVVLYFVIKMVPKTLRNRRLSIDKQLLDARSATEVADERLKGVEQRLSRLDEEIDAIRRNVEQEANQDQARIKAALEEERLRIVDSAGHEIDTAVAAAQRELRRYAAELAVERATSQLSLSEETDRKLVQNFSRGLGSGNEGNHHQPNDCQGGRN